MTGKRWTIAILPLFCKTGTFVANAQADCSQMLTANSGNTRNSNA